MDGGRSENEPAARPEPLVGRGLLLWAASGASTVAIAPDSTVRWTPAIIDP